MAGDRLVGDKAQDYIVGLGLTRAGSERKTVAPGSAPDGEALEWPVTVTDIKAGADGNTLTTPGCALKCEGDPLLVEEAAGTELPET